MRVSSKGRYGVRFLMELAMRDAGGEHFTPLKFIAERQDISEKYLSQIVSTLKKQGIIRSTTGPGGGYALMRPAVAITLHDILGALEGSDALVACTHAPGSCPRSNACAARAIWQDVDARIAEVLRGVTLQDMVDRQRDLTPPDSVNYTI